MAYTIGNFVQRVAASSISFLKNAAYVAMAGAAAGGVIVSFSVSRLGPNTNATLNDTHIAANLLAKENTSGCITGTSTGCIQIVVGVTENAFVFTKSGGIIVGPLANPRFVASGSLVKIGGGHPRVGEPLSVVGTMSGSKVVLQPTTGTAAVVMGGGAKGSHICYRDTDNAGWTACDALNATVSCRIASAGECP